MGATVQDASAGVSYYSIGIPIKRRELTRPRPNTLLEQCTAVATLLAFFGSFYLLGFLHLVAPVLLFTRYQAVGCFLLASMAAAWYIPPGQEWQWFRRSWIFDTWRRYFRMSLVVPELPYLEPRTYIFVQCPHACFPMASLLNLALADFEKETGVPKPVTGVTADVLLKLPFYKHFFAWNGCHRATQKVMLKLLRNSTVGLLPEGVAGIFEGATRQRERAFIHNRKGFVRVAIMAGVGLIPVYQLGNSQMLTYCGSAYLSRKFRQTMGFFWGWMGLPLPHPHELITCVGPAIEVKQCDQPTQTQIDETHARFVAALEELYYQHRHLIPGWENRPLEVC